MKRSLTLVLFAGLLALAAAAYAATDTATITFNADLDEIAVIDVTNGGVGGNLVLVAPGQGGAAIASDTDNSLYAQYTSVVSGATLRTISARISSGSVPAGTQLALSAGTPSGGSGARGTETGNTVLSGVAANIITDIGSCYTGTGGTDGSQLTFTLSVANYGALVSAAANSIEVTLTLTEDL